MDLDYLRSEIDNIDTQLTELFVKRMNICKDIAKYKIDNGLSVLNKGRERQILSRVSKLAGEELEDYTRLLFSTLFDLSRSYQHMQINADSALDGAIHNALENTPKLFPSKGAVACQGVEGAYSQQACDKVFAFADILYFKSFGAVFDAVEKGMCRFGVLPIENSSHGSVNAVYDLMRHHNFHIVRAARLHISHCLLAKRGTDMSQIKEILSHEQAIGQCSKFLSSLPNVKVTVCENTATAAKYVAESDRTDIAAISSQECAGLYGLNIVKERIHNTDNNYTRFIVISKDLEIYPGADKISIMFALDNTPGSLSQILSRFSSLDLNVTKLESRPIPGTDFQYMFYMDIEASIYTPELIKLLSELDQELSEFTFLGSYNEV